MRRCDKCLTPDTIHRLDKAGVCSACRNIEAKRGIDWKKRKRDLEKLLERYRRDDGAYDCIIPVSGGKDSTYQVYLMKDVFKMHPLCITFAACGTTRTGECNLRNMRSLGVDHILFTPNPGVYRKLYRLGFETTGDMCYPCHRGIFTVPVRTAVDMRIPLIIWGENPVAEYGGPAADADNPYLDRRYMELYSGVKEVGIGKFLKYGFTEFELRPWVYPSDEEIKKAGVTGVFLGYYIEWNTDGQLETVTKLGFRRLEKDERRETTYNTFRHVDCKYFDLHYYIMYLKFGYSRATQDVAIDIRDGKLTKDEGMKLIERFEGNFPERYFRDFLEFTGMTEEEFWKTAEGWRGRDTKGPTDAWRKDKKGVWVLNDETVFSIRK